MKSLFNSVQNWHNFWVKSYWSVMHRINISLFYDEQIIDKISSKKVF